jgi:hypothetical protein
MKCAANTALIYYWGEEKGFENEWVACGGVTYEGYYCSIIVPLTIILFGDPSIHNAKLLLILVLRRSIYVCEGTPTNFVPVWNGTSLCGR